MTTQQSVISIAANEGRSVLVGADNVGSTPGRVLLVFSPASPMEQFFAEVGTPVADKANPPTPDGPPDMDRFMAICHKYQVEFVAPVAA